MITANGAPVLRMTLVFPASGLWVLSAEVDSEDALEGALELTDGANVFAGTVLRSGAIAGSCTLEAVGGEGGLVDDVDATHYRNAAARTVFEEILAATGETYESTSTRAIMTTSLPYWSRAQARGTRALAALAEALGARWRVLPSGRVWMGTETWPKAPEFEYTELDRDLASEQVLIAPEQLDFLPGQTLKNGDRVGQVTYTMTRSEHLRAVYYLEA